VVVSDPACPSCGETERLAGATIDGRIEITCEACGTAWERSGRRCRGCGSAEHTVARQRMITFPRGNQLAVIGMREVPLCPQCDAAALTRLGPDRLLDDRYRSRFVGGIDDEPAGQPPPRAKAAPRPPARQTVPRTPPAGTPPTGTPPTARPVQRPATREQPTVRQAVQDYLEQADDSVSATAMLVVGRTLGPSTRLADISGTTAGPRLAQAVDEQWSRQPALRALAVGAITDAFRLWVRRGWMTGDQTPHLDG